MSEILQSEESVKLYEYEPYKPDLEDCVMHYNHNHDPRNGQFTSGKGTFGGGSVEKIKKKAARASVKAARANKRAAQANNKFLHPFKARKKDKLQAKAFKAQAEADKLNAKLDKKELRDTAKERIKNNKEIDQEVKRARETGKYDMEFLERNLDLDPVTEEQMTGKALDNAYRKFLKEENNKVKNEQQSSRDFNDNTKYGGFGFREIRTSEKITDKYKNKGEEGYLKIKPEKEMSKKEMEDFWKEEFNKASREAGGSGWGGKDSKSKQLGKLQNQLADAYAENASRSEVDRLLKEIKKVSGKDANKALEPEPKKTFREKLKDRKVQKKRQESLAKAREAKAANVEKRKTESAEKERISKMREDAIKKNDIVTMYKNADHFSRAEIEEALNRKGTLDRLASEVSKMTPTTDVSKGKQFKNMVKDSAKKGASDFVKSTAQNVARNALNMTLQELAVRAAGGTPTNFKSLPSDQKKALVLRLFREKK